MSLLSPLMPLASPPQASPAVAGKASAGRDGAFDDVFAAAGTESGPPPAEAQADSAPPSGDQPPDTAGASAEPPAILPADGTATLPGDPAILTGEPGLPGPAGALPAELPVEGRPASGTAQPLPQAGIAAGVPGGGVPGPVRGAFAAPVGGTERGRTEDAAHGGASVPTPAQAAEAARLPGPAAATAAPDPAAAVPASDIPLSGSLADDATLAPQTAELRRTAAESSMTLHRGGQDGPPPPERQVAAAILSSASGRTEILLDPADLGRVRLSLEGNEAGLVVTIQAERSDTADLLRRNADLLMEEFREAGYADLTFSFSDRSGPDDSPEPRDDAPRVIVAEAAALSPPTHPAPRGTALLDLRL